MPRPTISLFLPSLSAGGAERVTVNLANALAQHGLHVHMVLGSANGELLGAVSKPVTIVDLQAPRTLDALPLLVRYLRQSPPSALVTALEHASVVAWAARTLSRAPTALVIAQHSRLDRPERLRGFKARLQRMLMKWVYPRASALIAVSAAIADEMATALPIPRNRIQVIYNPVVTDELLAMADEPVADTFCERAEPLILGVGRLTEPKDFPLLVKAFAVLRRRFPSARLLILGEGPERQFIEDEIRSMGLEGDVALPGFVPNPYAYMKRAHCFVLSSRWEVLPTVLIEALVLGTPVVSTDCSAAVYEILGEVAGRAVVPQREPEALAQAIERALSHPSEAVPGLERFTAREVARQYATLIPR